MRLASSLFASRSARASLSFFSTVIVNLLQRYPCRSLRAPIAPAPKALSRTRPQRSARSRETVDRKSTRLNSSHVKISYAVFCLKKKKKEQTEKREAHKKVRVE